MLLTLQHHCKLDMDTATPSSEKASPDNMPSTVSWQDQLVVETGCDWLDLTRHDTIAKFGCYRPCQLAKVPSFVHLSLVRLAVFLYPVSLTSFMYFRCCLQVLQPCRSPSQARCSGGEGGNQQKHAGFGWVANHLSHRRLASISRGVPPHTGDTSQLSPPHLLCKSEAGGLPARRAEPCDSACRAATAS